MKQLTLIITLAALFTSVLCLEDKVTASSQMQSSEYVLQGPVITSYPNPFNPQTIISIGRPLGETMTLDIYNVMGQKIKHFDESDISSGSHSVAWDGTNDDGNPVASGTYFVYLNTGAYHSTHKMILLK